MTRSAQCRALAAARLITNDPFRVLNLTIGALGESKRVMQAFPNAQRIGRMRAAQRPTTRAGINKGGGAICVVRLEMAALVCVRVGAAFTARRAGKSVVHLALVLGI